MPAAITYHLDLRALPTRELKRTLRDRALLSAVTYAEIQAELLRRGDGYHSP